MRVTSLEDRLTILMMSKAGCPDRQIAEQLNWSLGAVRKWRRRGEKGGTDGLVSAMGRPRKGAMSSFPTEVQETLLAWRCAHPGWGPKTLRAELERSQMFPSESLPCRAVIARWLREKGLTRRYERHRELPVPAPVSAQAPHEEWEMDARGYQRVPDIGMITLVNLSDRFSKVKILSYPFKLGEKRASRHLNTADYQLVLRLAFTEWGLPDRLLVDRDSVFYDNNSKSPFPTHLHLWLLSLGVLLIVGPPNRPTDRAEIERSHQTWAQQALVGQRYDMVEDLTSALMRRRLFLNEWLPCATLGDVPPLKACPEARKPRRIYRPEQEASLMDVSRVYAYLSQGQWFRRASNIGGISLGGQVYALGRDWAHKDVEVIFDPTDNCLVFQMMGGDLIKLREVKGVSPMELMGEAAPFARFPVFQLQLPFTDSASRVLRLCETLSDTTY